MCTHARTGTWNMCVPYTYMYISVRTQMIEPIQAGLAEDEVTELETFPRKLVEADHGHRH